MRSLKLLTLLCLPSLGIPQESQQDISTAIRQDPKTAYYNVKRLYVQFWQPSAPPKSAPGTTQPKEVDLESCERGSEFLAAEPTGNELAKQFADLAAEIVQWRWQLRQIGYPENVWRPMLIRFEDQQIAIATQSGKLDTQNGQVYRNFAKQLAQSLNGYAQTHPGFPKAIVEGECGAGAFSVRFSTEPPGGRISIIPQFWYMLCEASKIDPSNPKTCNKWHDVVTTEEPVSGGYVYTVRWPDGTSTEGRIDASRFSNDLETNIVLKR